MKLRHIALLLFPLLVALCSAWGPKIIKGPCPSVTKGDLLPPNMTYWWRSTNVSPGSFTNWDDALLSVRLKSVGSTNLLRGTSPEGVYFGVYDTRERKATNASWAIFGSNCVIALILNNRPIQGTFGGIMQLRDVESPSTYNYSWNGSDGATTFKLIENAPGALNLTADFVATGRVDVVLVRSNSDGNTTFTHCYTNGQYSASASVAGPNFDYARLDMFAYSYYGQVIEMQVWTNLNDWRSSTSNFHYYATNTYGGTP